MRQWRATIGRNIRMPYHLMNEAAAKKLPMKRAAQDERGHQNRMYELQKSGLAAQREQFNKNQAFAQKALEDREKDMDRARRIGWAGVGANVLSSGLGAFLNSDSAEDSFEPATQTVAPEITDSISGMLGKSDSVWGGASDDNSFDLGATDYLKRWGDESLNGLGDLYNATVGDLFPDFSLDDFDLSNDFGIEF